jgi:glutamate 5-kinase
MRLVIKIGSSSLTDARGALDDKKLDLITHVVVECTAHGHEVVLVSSGAVAAGLPVLKLTPPIQSAALRQAAAAVGQGLLVHHYTEKFRRHGIPVAQILLTRRDFAIRESYNNALRALTTLLEHKTLPIINENDVVVLRENSFGDNDSLGALVSALLHADMYLICTDVDGVYSTDPRTSPDAKLIHHLTEIPPELLRASTATGSSRGRGGMASKLRACARADAFGVQSYIGATVELSSWADIIVGHGKGTYIGDPAKSPRTRKAQWIAFHSEVGGSIQLDQGATDALLSQNRSLLPAGVTEVQGDFSAGSVVEVYGPTRELIGKGISDYSAQQLLVMRGKSSQTALAEWGIKKAEVIHRDNWVPLSESSLV